MNEREQCVSACIECATLLRLGRSIEAGLDMLDVCEQASVLLDSRPAIIRHQWVAVLSRMHDCQQAQDWLGLADYMDHELVELLNAE
ncbi:hypothetical protein KDX38_03970 [Pseudomonas sp. CDFA 602]|uniref:hypothetical protein n=1 Tax=Pseudomonas californiensis TaxID=2829823 RepID=UPI001E371921|nr:hypothetical protein [Pseudomonas californiensis]MCD5992993.1 hypothetical protein [Pseudomonas californiensis]MCD5998370.1 hypothetical protein [Pseudomonas californiensis]